MSVQVALALLLAQGTGSVSQVLPVRHKQYRDSGVVSYYVNERVLREYDEVLSALEVPEVLPDEEYAGSLEGLEELQLGYGQALPIENEGVSDRVCSNCYGALPGTCSFCSPDKVPMHIRTVPGFSLLLEQNRRGKMPAQFAVA